MQLASNLFYFALHVTGAGSFPPPLSAAKETELLKYLPAEDIFKMLLCPCRNVFGSKCINTRKNKC